MVGSHGHCTGTRPRAKATGLIIMIINKGCGSDRETIAQLKLAGIDRNRSPNNLDTTTQDEQTVGSHIHRAGIITGDTVEVTVLAVRVEGGVGADISSVAQLHIASVNVN